MGLKIEDTIKKQAKECNDLHFFLVENISNLMTGKLNKTAVESSDFYVSGLKWRFLIGQSKGLKDHLSFYLWITDEKCTGSNWEVKFTSKISVVSHTGQEKCNGITNQRFPSYGIDQFISYAVLKERYLVNDATVFCAKIWDVQPNFLITYIPQPKATAERIKLMNIPRNNCRFTWKITQFSSFTAERHSSYEFTVGQRRWKLLMYPNGNQEAKGNSLSLYLTATDYVTNGPKGRTLAVYKLRVLDQLHRNHHESGTYNYWFPYDPTENESSWGLHKFLSLEELHKASRGFLVKDEIYIGVEFLIVSVSESIYGDNI